MINKKAFIFDTVAEAHTYKIGADAKNTTYRTSFAEGATIYQGEPDIPYHSEILIRETSQVWRCNQWWGGSGGGSCINVMSQVEYNTRSASNLLSPVFYAIMTGTTVNRLYFYNVIIYNRESAFINQSAFEAVFPIVFSGESTSQGSVLPAAFPMIFSN